MSTLEQWRFEPDGGDWDDVLRRARRRLPFGRAALAVAAALVVAGPALGLVGSLGSGHSHPRLTAALSGPGGATGTFTALAPGFWVAKHGGRRVPFMHTRPLLIGWNVRAPGTVTSVRLGATTLCDPCTKPRGVLLMKPRPALRLLTGKPVVTVTAGGTTLRGTLVVR
jgi:hypothetical protein